MTKRNSYYSVGFPTIQDIEPETPLQILELKINLIAQVCDQNAV